MLESVFHYGFALGVWETSQFCNFFVFNVLDTGIVIKIKLHLSYMK